MNEKKQDFVRGFKSGIPIMLGYLPVAFTYAATFVGKGLSPIVAIIISMTNLTSAGQVAGTDLILKCASLLEIAATVFIINIRYMLMSLSLSQKIDKMPVKRRAILAFGITDEVFGVAATSNVSLTFYYMLGLIAGPFLGWTFGTVLGAYTIGLFNETLKSAMGIAIYGMFIAIVVPGAKRSKPILIVVAVAVALSTIFYYVPVFDFLSSGWAILISSFIAAAIGAKLFPLGGDGDA